MSVAVVERRAIARMELAEALAAPGDAAEPRLLVTASGYALLFLAAVGLGGGWLIAGWVLRPLRHITSAAPRTPSGALDHWIGLTGRRDELVNLSDALHDTLDLFRRPSPNRRRFAANAAHDPPSPTPCSTSPRPTRQARLQITIII
jgi:HAMP domain-containing protein